jgi:16S rRNA (cytosine1402-N4)-methyltransferase
MSEIVYHIPALLTPCIEGLNVKSDGVYADVTFGAGGHSRAIVERLGENGRLYGFDQDKDAIANAIDDPKFTFVYSNFSYISNFMRYYGENGIDGIMAYLGVSFHHFDECDRGFSVRFNGKLDMRMNQNAERDAQWIVANYSEEQLAQILFLYGELKSSRRIAAAIVKARQSKPITTTGELIDVITPCLNPRQEKKEAILVFQALRIEVNNEIEVLKSLLQQSLKVLKPGGRFVVLTYHSLEDRLVKNFFKTGNIEGKMEKDFFGRSTSPFKLINNKVIVASPEEVERNPRSRSAKLRIAEKL